MQPYILVNINSNNSLLSYGTMSLPKPILKDISHWILNMNSTNTTNEISTGWLIGPCYNFNDILDE